MNFPNGTTEHPINKSGEKDFSIARKKVCFFPYIGGKFNLLKILIPLIPPHEIYVEVFGGAASLLLNKPPSRIEVYNDVDGELVNLFMVVRDRPKDFVGRFRLLVYSRELYMRWLRGRPPKDPVERAVRFYYIMRCSFGGNYGASWAFKRKAHKHAPDIFWSSLERIEQIAKRLKSTYIDALDFRMCIRNWDTPDTLFFCDPPYYGLDYYRHSFSAQDHRDLRKVLGETKGKWLLTYGEHPEIRRLYRGFCFQEARQLRSSNLVKDGGKRTHFTNLVIANYPLKGRS